MTDNEARHRRSIRLPGYDYSTAGGLVRMDSMGWDEVIKFDSMDVIGYCKNISFVIY